MVIESHPRLEDGSPFPTTYWLTCPVLNKRVGTLEAEGWMNDVNERLATDADARRCLSAAIERYRDRRNEHELIEDSGSPPGGGPERVKCAHAHVAHELAGGNNPVGQSAFAAVGYPDCAAPCYLVPT